MIAAPRTPTIARAATDEGAGGTPAPGLRLYNTLTRRKEVFRPIDPAHVRMYVCGPTVYDDIHIGNARPIVTFDLLYRLLKRLYPKVTYVRNITDVDDKIIARAEETGEAIGELTERTVERFRRDVAALAALAPDEEPRATDHIPEMIDLIGRLEANGKAYRADGHVLFHVPSMPDYGKLSGRNRDEMVAGARVEVAPYKKDPADFVLWKPSTPDQPGWDSPWGRGRPGWHIECSAMSMKYLGPDFDIHGGGQDLIFPHHENEIAQSVSAHPGKSFARYWVHNGYLQTEGQKMSKSLGNIVTVRELLRERPGDIGELLEGVPGEVIRFGLISAQYRQPLDWTEALIRQSRRRLNRLYNVLYYLSDDELDDETVIPFEFMNALEDDLNTPMALSVMERMVRNFNKLQSDEDRSRLKSKLLICGQMLGLLQENPKEWRQRKFSSPGRFGRSFEELISSIEQMLDDADIERRIAERVRAREAKDFAEADRIRAELLSKWGIVLEDKPDGTTEWRRAD